ncbi:MAG: glycoside hydrolase family 2 [Bacteroidetes bacterium GWE2_41_25]|nr:MAG: glycoside hydrolase family 2 [Bacteroidetes bacterium GWA2_40_15]OFX82591.1 MAG: glycoside hydrolase family 2 [Bacteroidetes bacterium GWC2_40_22]OFY07553.1 MAG: glycoside hydrolase family 2 [Bacteroidetes bacterium GWE2_41_25]HBQ83141.1 glycoside hydrolase family 2 [Bacteroidales bacterium]HCU17816.1 glycoside hydrolase family 2 [Bacteroidales bacterium]
MDRRKFISDSIIYSSGLAFVNRHYPLSKYCKDPDEWPPVARSRSPVASLYELFKNPPMNYHPYVRWWWNGNKVEAKELIRELRLLHAAGIGGVEINPVEFPTRFEGDDLGKPSVKWLSDEWIDLLKIVFDEAKLLGMVCDLIVGSGWPFGSESLPQDERSQVVVIAVKKLTGPLDYEISKFELFKEADPAISSPFPGRTMELLSLQLVPDPLENIEQTESIHLKPGDESVKISVPEGKYALYGLVKINAFMEVINGAPGATGPVLDHYNREAVTKYLEKMSGTIEKKTGPLSGHIRALFTDSMELEGSNWYEGMRNEFIKRNGYDIFPFLPFVLFKTGAMGNVTDFRYGVTLSSELESDVRRMRYGFEVTKAEIIRENFTKIYINWCKELKVKSRAQAYGRGLFPLESSFDYDIPEGESWTMNWLKHKVGEEMPESDYRRGRAYTMINKFVSSAAHLKSKRLVSCEEMTDTYTVFNTSLENLKIGSDQSVISGITHSIFHGFNYSPPEAPYPGWIRYGAYYNEKNTWWPYFHLINEYKGRLSALLQNVTMYADIAILPPLDDMWSLIGAQMEPFPSITHVDYFTLVWEAINKNGNGCDYVSQPVIRDAEMNAGFMHYGTRRYSTIFLVKVDSLHPETAGKLLDFIFSGGRVFCIESVPSASPGYKNFKVKDEEIRILVEKMKEFPERFILLEKPEKDFTGWYKRVQEKYNIKPYLTIEKPDPFVMQNRYQGDNGTEVIYLINSHNHNSHNTRISFSKEITSKRYGWIWDPETGNRYRIKPDRDNSLILHMGPAESFLFVFDNVSKGPEWKPIPASGASEIIVNEVWIVQFTHCRDGSVKTIEMNTLCDIKDIPELFNFAGTITYINSFSITGQSIKSYLNLGKVHGLCEVILNGNNLGVRWYGERIYSISESLKEGKNEIEIRVVTSMGNYMKSLTDNPIAQYWTNEKNKVQPLQSMGLIGPVTINKTT